MSNLMIVEDDEILLEVLAAALTAEGHSVVTASSGIPALDILDSGQRLDLLITDVMMPGLNGFSLARMARARRPLLRILYISGHAAEIDRDKGVRLGKLLSKPIMVDDFAREVAGALVGSPIANAAASAAVGANL